jgi:hypothetical protein
LNRKIVFVVRSVTAHFGSVGLTARLGIVVLINRNAAVIPAEKLRDYSLSPTHPIGRYKATFFRTLGYDQSNWQVLGGDLRSLLSMNAEQLDVTEYDRKKICGHRFHHGAKRAPGGDCLRLDYTGGRGNAALYYGIPKGLANEL